MQRTRAINKINNGLAYSIVDWGIIIFLQSSMYQHQLRKLPKPFPILYGLPDDPKAIFQWRKHGLDDHPLQARADKVQFNFDAPPSSDRGFVRPYNIYYHNFCINVGDSLEQYKYELIDYLPNLAKSCAEQKHEHTTHPSDYEIFGGFEGSNVHQIYYCKYDIVKIVLRSDTNSLGYCQWFCFGLRILNPKKELRITIVITNLRYLPHDGQVYINRVTDNHRFHIPFQATESKIIRKHAVDRKGKSSAASLRKKSTEIFTNPRLKQQTKYHYYQATMTYVHRVKQSEELIYIYSQKPFSFVHLKQQFPKWAHADVRISQIGTSRLRFPIHCISITDNQRNPQVQVSDRKNVLIIARARPVDTYGSMVAEEIINYLQTNALAKALFKFWIIPILNPDGVLVGNSRCNVSGRDLTREYSKPGDMTPETKSLAEIGADFWMAIDLRVDWFNSGYQITSYPRFAAYLGLKTRSDKRVAEERNDISLLAQGFAKIFTTGDTWPGLGPRIVDSLVSTLTEQLLAEQVRGQADSTYKPEKLTRSESRQRFKSTESPKKGRSDSLLQLAKQQKLQPPANDRPEDVSFLSETDHDDDMLESSDGNKEAEPGKGSEVKQQGHESRHQVDLAGMRGYHNAREEEVVNQLRNIEWKDTQRSFERTFVLRTPQKKNENSKFKTSVSSQKSTSRTASQTNLFKFLTRNIGGLKSQQTQTPLSDHKYHSESRLSESTSQSRIILKNPFLRDREELFQDYRMGKRSRNLRGAQSFSVSNNLLITYNR